MSPQDLKERLSVTGGGDFDLHSVTQLLIHAFGRPVKATVSSGMVFSASGISSRPTVVAASGVISVV